MASVDVVMMDEPHAFRPAKRPREEDPFVPRYVAAALPQNERAKIRRVDPTLRLGATSTEFHAGVFVRVMDDTQAVATLHQYPFYGPNPCPAARCGWKGMIVETGCGEWQQGVKVRFHDGHEWCYNPRALAPARR
eukprot:TRINITY_DN5065_c0_g1_i1.p4 TRINITY_DN5065_c0_g1~~TRINITY_DN5065_c0_g1_i1.p4  ORF type:complete len:135 (+),score=41.54 TRINITY_DN5065_c0_g1_i1:80-484(+)